MLVIRRRAGEAIWIGNVRVKVTSIRQGEAQIGIEAPDDVRIQREELLQLDDPNDQRTNTTPSVNRPDAAK